MKIRIKMKIEDEDQDRDTDEMRIKMKIKIKIRIRTWINHDSEHPLISKLTAYLVLAVEEEEVQHAQHIHPKPGRLKRQQPVQLGRQVTVRVVE